MYPETKSHHFKPCLLEKNSNTKLMEILYLVTGWEKMLGHMTTFNGQRQEEARRKRIPRKGERECQKKGASSGDSVTE